MVGINGNIGSIGILQRNGTFTPLRATSRSSKRKSNRKVSGSRSHSRKKRIRRTPHTAGKRKDRSKRRLRYTKNGQPYVILASGKARFVSSKSAKTSRKRKGGRY